MKLVTCLSFLLLIFVIVSIHKNIPTATGRVGLGVGGTIGIFVILGPPLPACLAASGRSYSLCNQLRVSESLSVTRVLILSVFRTRLESL